MRSRARGDISAVLERAGLSQNVYDDAVGSVRVRPRVEVAAPGALLDATFEKPVRDLVAARMRFE